MVGVWASIFFVQCAVVRPSVRHAISSKQVGGIQPNLLHHFSSWLGCARQDYFSVYPCDRPSVCHVISSFSTGRNSTKLATSVPLMVRVCESNIFSVRPSSVHLSLTLSPPKQPTSLPLIVRMCESNISFPCVRRSSICPSRYRLQNHWAKFNQTCYNTFLHGKGLREQLHFSLRPSGVYPFVRHAISS